jgi:hypothetical protein
MGKASESLRRKAIGPFLSVLLRSGSQLRYFGYRLRRFDILFFQAGCAGNEKGAPRLRSEAPFFMNKAHETGNEN